MSDAPGPAPTDAPESTPSKSASQAEGPSRPVSQMSRREAMKTMGAAGLASLLASTTSACAPGGAGGPDEPPNIIFILTDDHTVRGLSCYGSEVIDTPNLDRIAEGGVRFDNCFVTNSLCAPSRATMLTGKYSHKHGVQENIFGDKEPFDGSQMTFPKRLQEAGYTTAQLGKWHLQSEPTGFDYYKRLNNQGRYNDPFFLESTDGSGDPERVREEGYVTDIITDMTIDAIDRYQQEDGPFCLLSWHKAPHRGWIPKAEDKDLYTDFDMPPPPTLNDDHFSRSSAVDHSRMSIANMPDWRDEQPDGLSATERKHWNYQRYIKDYLRTVKGFDRQVGRLLDHLEEQGLADNTLVIYTSDNGMFIGEHGFYDKRFMYEESIRIPLMMRLPGAIPAGTVEDRVVMNLDFAETILDYAGAEIPSDMQGKSLRPLLEGDVPEGEWRNELYYHYYEYPGPHYVRPNYGIRTGRYKLIYYYTIDEWELFDLEKDPHELQNMADAPAYQDVKRRLAQRLKDMRSRYEDTTGKPVPEAATMAADTTAASA
jgi:arylsulfatase A-like enzyme